MSYDHTTSSYQSFFRLTERLLLACLLTLGLAACGGGGGGSDDGGSGGSGGPGPNITDNIPTTTSIPTISGLTGDANQSYPLFYIDASHSDPASSTPAAQPYLMAYDPMTDTSNVIDKRLSLLGSQKVFPATLHGATFDATTGKASNYHIASVVYAQDKVTPLPGGSTLVLPGKLMRVDVSSTTPQQISSDAGLGAAAMTGKVIAFDLNDPDKALFAFEAGDPSVDPRQFKRVSFDADTTEAPQSFAPGLITQTNLFNTSVGYSDAWLVVDTNQGNCLARVEDADLAIATCIPNADGSGNVELQKIEGPASFVTGTYWLDNGVVLTIATGASATGLSVTNTLWFYEYGDIATPGKLHLLKNDAGESLETSELTMFGEGQAGRVVGKDGNTLYIAAGDGGLGDIFGDIAGGSGVGDIETHAFLYKITSTPGQIGWEEVWHKGGGITTGEGAIVGGFLVDAGTRLLWEINEKLIAISLDGQNSVTLDGRSNTGGISAIAAVSQDGWFFYNRQYDSKDYATAIKVDGTKRVELKGCRWIGASTSGNTNYAGGRFFSLQPSEVFMACNNKEIAAVDADNPLGGRVILGELSKAAESIGMGRPAPGPHRLIRVAYEDGLDESFEVVYVNTRTAGSLKHLMAAPANDDLSGAGMTAPIDGF